MASSPPIDRSATECVAVVRAERNRWVNLNGSCSVVLLLRGKAGAAKGQIFDGEVIAPGDEVQFFGRWAEHPQWGWHFLFDSFQHAPPPSGSTATSPEAFSAMVSYLSRHAKGIGPAYARKIVAEFGDEAINALLERYAEVESRCQLPANLAREAGESIRMLVDPALRAAHIELHSLLRGHGFPGYAIKEILTIWEDNAPSVIRKDPFAMLANGIPGAGFTRCDRVWRALGKDLLSPKRQMYAAWHSLRSARNGHTWCPVREIFPQASRLIGTTGANERRAFAALTRARRCEFRMDPANPSRVWIGERSKTADERRVAQHTKRLLGCVGARWPLDRIQQEAISEHQRSAMLGFADSKLAILTGGPGTGKTHCAAALIRAIGEIDPIESVLVCAPTGKAAVRITAKLHQAGVPIQATTIHRALGVKGEDGVGGFVHDERSPLSHNWIIVDEVSMCDAHLMACLLASCGSYCHVLLVGDQHQLPPVGHGAPLRDMLTAGVPNAQLTEIRRNSGAIVKACAEIRQGRMPRPPQTANAYPAENLLLLDPSGTASRDTLLAIDRVYTWLAEKGINLVDDVQVLCAKNATRRMLNTHLQAKLNPSGKQHLPGTKYRIGDKVICLKNGRYLINQSVQAELPEDAIASQRGAGHLVYVANGDLGRLESFDRQGTGTVALPCPDRKIMVPLVGITKDSTEEDEESIDKGYKWDLAWAVTCHKYQGSECPVVVVLLESSGMLSSREWIYTAISRAKDLCILVGDTNAIAEHVRRVTLPDRKTFLVEELLKKPM